MNGRIYDPVIARFLSPDPYVQAPESPQNYNRYSYCLNNPLKYADPNGEWVVPVIVGIVGGAINLWMNWDNVDGFWDGFTTFIVGGASAAAACFTGGMSFWGGAGIVVMGGALTGVNNDIVRQTDKNFKGINEVNWLEVGMSGTASGIAGFCSFGFGYGAVHSPFINGIKSPMLRSLVVSPATSAAGHIAGGTTYNLMAGQDIGDAFENSTRGLGTSMVMGTITSTLTTFAVARAQGINPWTDAKSASYNSVGAKGAEFDAKKISTAYLKQQGLDAHEIKFEYVGKTQVARYELYKTPSGQIIIMPRHGTGVIWTDYYIR